MKNNLLIGLLVVGFVFCCLPGRKQGELAANELDVRTALDSLEAKLGWIAYRANSERWEQFAGSVDDSLVFFERLEREVIGQPQFYEDLRGQRAQLNGDIDQRRFDLLYPAVALAQIDGSRLIRGLRDSLVEFYERPWCRWEGGFVFPGFLQAVAATARGSASREQAYRAASSPGQTTTQQLARLFRLRNQVTRRMGYNDYLSLTLDLTGIESEAYLQFLDAVDSVTRKPFENLIGELRGSMDGEPLEVYDWESRFVRTIREADALLPVDSQRVYIKRFAAGMGFDIDRLPIYWRTAADNVTSNQTEILVITPAHDVRIVTRLADGLQSYRSLARAVGLAMRSVLVVQESELLARTIEPGWSEGIAGLFERLAVETDGLQFVAGASSGLQTRLARAAQAIRMLRLRLLLVEARLEYDAYRNPGRDLNEQYWDLFDKYVGLPRHDDLTPWATDAAFVEQPLAAYYQLLGECAAAQNVNYLSRHYDRIVDKEALGAFLNHSYFRFGARYDWQELIERATGEQLSPDFLTRN